MMILGASFDVVEVIRSLVTEVDSLQKIVAGQEARLQVCEAKAEAEVEVKAEAKPKRGSSPSAIA